MNADDLLEAFEVMLRARLFEEEVGRAVSSGQIHGEMHLGIGQEAVAPLRAEHLRPRRGGVDASGSSACPRCGVIPSRLAAVFERDGLNDGKGGHMHLFDPGRHFMCTGIVGAAAPIAARAMRSRSSSAGTVGLTVAVAGDGAMNQGGSSRP